VLVAVAVLGTYAAATHAAKDETVQVVVAARDIAPGTRIQPADIKVLRLALPDSVAGHVLTSSAKAIGATTLGPLRAGDVAQAGQLTPPNANTTPYLEVSFSLPAARALDGELRSGETVDILTTDKSNPASVARVAASDAHVLRTQASGSGSVGHSGDVTVTVGVISRTDAAAIAAAVDQGQVTLVRTTGAKS
jgi:hypothetical protein